jgi:hypothetical protein
VSGQIAPLAGDVGAVRLALPFTARAGILL